MGRGRGTRAGIAARVRDLLDDPNGDPDHGDPDDGVGGGERVSGAGPVWRWRSSRRTTAAVGAVTALAAVITGVWVWSARPNSSSVGSAGAPVQSASGGPAASGAASVVVPVGESGRSSVVPTASGADTGSGSGTSAAGELVVDVAGKVRHPGVYRLPLGSRVYQALDAAGGALPGVSLTSLNLAATVSDGQQIVVGVAGTTGGAAPPGGATSEPGVGGTAPAGSQAAGTGTPVNLNTADLTTLESLPGIGPALAQRILDWRTQHGRFTSVDQLNDVSGIGEVKFGQLRGLVTV